jgi:hypothetical protein
MDEDQVMARPDQYEGGMNISAQNCDIICDLSGRE